MNYSIELDDAEVRAALRRVIDRGRDLRPVLLSIGETLSESTKERFRTGTAPDGTPWAPNSEVTELRNLRRSKGSLRKDGGLTAKGAQRLAAKRPLIGESKSLSTLIGYQVDGDSVLIGSPMIYAGTHQFGARKGQFGRNRRGGPIPWGDIPARPFLGVSDADRDEVVQLLIEYVEDAWAG